jgi:hypothetical protein
MILPLFQDIASHFPFSALFFRSAKFTQRCKARQNVGAPATLDLRASFKPPEESSNGFGAASHRCLPSIRPGTNSAGKQPNPL